HREVGIDELVLSRQVQPDLKQFERIRSLIVEKRKHLGVLNAPTRGQPLDGTSYEPSRRTERIRMVDDARTHIGDRFEPSMRMHGKTRDTITVIHVPAVDAREVCTDLASLERRGRTEFCVADRIRVEVMSAEQE